MMRYLMTTVYLLNKVKPQYSLMVQDSYCNFISLDYFLNQIKPQLIKNWLWFQAPCRSQVSIIIGIIICLHYVLRHIRPCSKISPSQLFWKHQFAKQCGVAVLQLPSQAMDCLCCIGSWSNSSAVLVRLIQEFFQIKTFILIYIQVGPVSFDHRWQCVL